MLKSLAAVFGGMVNPVVVADTKGQIIFLNPPAEVLYNRTLGAVSGQALTVLIPQSAWQGDYNDQTLPIGPQVVSVTRPDGTQLALTLSFWRTELQNERLMVVMTADDVNQNISPISMVEEGGARQNSPETYREGVVSCLNAAIAATRRDSKVLGVVVVNIDRFARVNTSFGDAFGDEALKVVRNRLVTAVGNPDWVLCRHSDQFVIMLPRLVDKTDVTTVLRKAVWVFDAPFKIHDSEVLITASFGISLCPEHGQDAEILLRHADMALRDAKKDAGNSFAFFQGALSSAFRHDEDEIGLEMRLREAINREEFVLHYQAKVDSESERIVGVEALTRWEPTDGTMVSPGAFIPVAEQSGLILDLGRWVLNSACRQAKQWQTEGLLPIPVAVNVSARQIKDPNFVSLVRWTLDETGLDPEWLNLELTETILMEDVEAIIVQMQALAECGVRFSIDDFGTGYSSLKYIKRFPIHYLKMDKFFVNDIASDRKASAMAQAITTIGHNLGLSVVAEGVETKEQLMILRAYRCDEIQGFLFSRPEPAAIIAGKFERQVDKNTDH